MEFPNGKHAWMVVRELCVRGHAVHYYSYEPFREKIEAAGAKFYPCEEFDAETRLTAEEGRRIRHRRGEA